MRIFKLNVISWLLILLTGITWVAIYWKNYLFDRDTFTFAGIIFMAFGGFVILCSEKSVNIYKNRNNKCNIKLSVMFDFYSTNIGIFVINSFFLIFHFNNFDYPAVWPFAFIAYELMGIIYSLAFPMIGIISKAYFRYTVIMTIASMSYYYVLMNIYLRFINNRWYFWFLLPLYIHLLITLFFSKKFFQDCYDKYSKKSF